MSCRIGVVFELRRAQTRPGEAVHVVGSRPELGEWQPLKEDGEEEARSLRTCPLTYPRWLSRMPIWFTLGAEEGALALQYKFVRDVLGLDVGHQTFRWEANISNRRVTLPAEDGSIWLVSHARWNCSRERPEVVQITQEEFSSRWCFTARNVHTPVIRSPPSQTPPAKEGVPRLSIPAHPDAEPAVVSAIKEPDSGRESSASETSLPDPFEMRRESSLSEFFALTPREDPQDASDEAASTGSGASKWDIEAEFSANFQAAAVNAKGLFWEKHGGDEASDLRLENERLRRALSEVREQAELLLAENAALQQKLCEAPIVCKQPSVEELREPQEEPQAIGDSPH